MESVFTTLARIFTVEILALEIYFAVKVFVLTIDAARRPLGSVRASCPDV